MVRIRESDILVRANHNGKFILNVVSGSFSYPCERSDIS